ncbi:MAG: hypothetical protein BMS9Abin13_197 [Patescibacteria group bacterium]|nr:MAG: hypothetical protein BMS9Abin13_197 [Patescibacteria group bacterium]
MGKTDFYNIAANTLNIFKERKNVVNFSALLIFFLGLFAFFYGLFTIPMPKGVLGFYRMVSPTSFEVFYMIFSAVVSALIVTVMIHGTKVKVEDMKDITEKRGAKNMKSAGVSAVGMATGIFGAVCPACLGINFLLLGNVFTAQLSFLIPYIIWVQLGGIILLSLGLYLVAKSAYEKKCISCAVGVSSSVPQKNADAAGLVSKKFIALALIAVALFAYQLTTLFGSGTGVASSGPSLVTTSGEKINIEDVIESVTPKEGFKTSVRWGDIVAKMVETGALDPRKLEDILIKRYGQEMKPQWRAVLAGGDANLAINEDNAVFMMYILWTLAKHNQNPILTDSPFAKYFTNYDIGVGKKGYGDITLLALTPAQQRITLEVAENAYRPCCNNSTARPDCSHGFSALGLVQLMASQGFSKDEILDVFVKFNSFWFPETYVKDALYFKITEGKDWKDVDKELVAGKNYSSLSGAYKVKNYLKDNFGI